MRPTVVCPATTSGAESGRASWCRSRRSGDMSPGRPLGPARRGVPRCPRQESNLRSRLRTPESCPLDHEGFAGYTPARCGGCRSRTHAGAQHTRPPFSKRLPYHSANPPWPGGTLVPPSCAEGARIERAPGRRVPDHGLAIRCLATRPALLVLPREAARRGFEPRLPDPGSEVLPVGRTGIAQRSRARTRTWLCGTKIRRVHRIHHPGKRALARSRTWTVRSLGPVPLPVGLRGRGVPSRGDPSSVELRAVAGIRTPTGLALSQVPLPVGLQPRSACGSRTRVFGLRGRCPFRWTNAPCR